MSQAKLFTTKLDLPQINRDICQYWKDQSIYKAVQTQSHAPGNPRFHSFDGPPFATGLPHHGHLLASTIKDSVLRYKTMMGFHVERRWGWDCHGLPIEYEIEKSLGIKTRQQVLDYTIPKYNSACRNIVLKYVDEWRQRIDLLGRWVDYENEWKTMDTHYMEQVWRVFRQIYDQQRIYKGFKVMPFSTGCHTPLSNFEAQSNNKQVSDYSLTVKMQLTLNSGLQLAQLLGLNEQARFSLLVWTTTPWTLPANVGICINAALTYVVVKIAEENDSNVSDDDNDYYYVIAKNCVASLAAKTKDAIRLEIVAEVPSKNLEGLQYVPLYKYYQNFAPSKSFRIMSDPYVTDAKGTGCVHLAPAFGADDYRVCLDNGLLAKSEMPPCPVDDDGCLTEPVDAKYRGVYFKTAESMIVADLKSAGVVLRVTKEMHEYPYCWRSETPLMYKIVPAWFLSIEPYTDELVKLNAKINWVPQHVGQNRFGNWLQNTKDWCISRNRYWGTPIPIWTNGDETIVPQSIAELESLCGIAPGTVQDLHIDSIDTLEMPSHKGGQPLRRVSEVLDCWFESGCVPYATHDATAAQQGPADFIAEGLDQTRGWFYTLHVISHALNKQPAFNNVIVNGLVLSKDGKKMAKKDKNYTPPEDIFNKYGAGPLRLYLLNSDVVCGEPLAFKETEIGNLIQVFYLHYHNSVKFLSEMVAYYEHFRITPIHKYWESNSLNNDNFDALDQLLLTCIHQCVNCIHSDMAEYKLNDIVKHLIELSEVISRIYIKLKKAGLKANKPLSQVYVELDVLYHALWTLTQMLAPFDPFMSEHYYQSFFKKMEQHTITERESIHLRSLPPPEEHPIYPTPLRSSSIATLFMNTIDAGHIMRTRLGAKGCSYKRPLQSLKIIHARADKLIAFDTYLKQELNVMEIEYSTDDSQYVRQHVTADYKKLAKDGHKHVAKILQTYLASANADGSAYNQLQTLSCIELPGLQLSKDYFEVQRHPLANEPQSTIDLLPVEIVSANGFVFIINTEMNSEILYQYELRQLTRKINDHRNQLGFDITDQMLALYTLQTSLDEPRLLSDLAIKTKTQWMKADLIAELESLSNTTQFKTADTSIAMKYMFRVVFDPI